MRFAWSDDFGFASMYALEESPRVIAAIRDAAFGFTSHRGHGRDHRHRWDDFYRRASR